MDRELADRNLKSFDSSRVEPSAGEPKSLDSSCEEPSAGESTSLDSSRILVVKSRPRGNQNRQILVV